MLIRRPLSVSLLWPLAGLAGCATPSVDPVQHVIGQYEGGGFEVRARWQEPDEHGAISTWLLFAAVDVGGDRYRTVRLVSANAAVTSALFGGVRVDGSCYMWARAAAGHEEQVTTNCGEYAGTPAATWVGLPVATSPHLNTAEQAVVDAWHPRSR